MKPSFESLHPVSGNSFHIRKFDESRFTAPFHYHPEYELTIILKGEGKRYVGSSLSPYKPGDLVLLGSNLPHCWKSDNINPGKINASSIVIQFTHNFLGDAFLNHMELSRIATLLLRSRSGIHFHGKTAVAIADEIVNLHKETDNFLRLINLLQILQRLATTRQYTLLDKQYQSFHESPAEQKRINEVVAYIVENFREDISLEKAAEVTGLTPTAFCKYYKKQTRKTFIETVMEYRLNYAAQLLVTTDKSISAICYESGFGDVSHFYKSFHKQKLLSPLNYRKKFSSGWE